MRLAPASVVDVGSVFQVMLNLQVSDVLLTMLLVYLVRYITRSSNGIVLTGGRWDIRTSLQTAKHDPCDAGSITK
jgi:hypothetical protein